jgi:flagellar hook-associated protein 2
MSSTSGVGATSSLEALIQQLMVLERQPVKRLEAAKSELNVRSGVFNDLKAKLLALQTEADALSQTAGILNKFGARSASSSNTAVLTARADGTSINGTHTLHVDQLAKPDTLTTKKFTDSGTDIIDGEGAGTKTIRIRVDGTDYDVNVTLSSGQSNKTILTNMASAINGHAGASAKVEASVVQIDSTSSKLVLRSKQTGLAHVMTLSNVTGTLFTTTDLRDSAAADDANNRGGYIYADNLLDAKFKLDGLSLTRASNTVTDALTGVTLNLLAAQDAADPDLTLTVGPDKAAIKTSVESFLTKYNDLIKYLNDKTKVAGSTRGGLAADFAYTELRMRLRSLMASTVSSVTAGNPKQLSEIGITAAADGTLSITDLTLFNKELDDGATSVGDLFNSSNGLAVQLKSILNGYTTAGGIVDNSKDSITRQIRFTDDRIAQQNERLRIREDALRRQLSAIQRALNAAVAQRGAIANILSASGLGGTLGPA